MNHRLIRSLMGMRLRRVAADRANLIWLIVMPLVFSGLMGKLMGSWSTGADARYTFIVYGAAEGGEAVTAMLDDLSDHADFVLVRRDTTATAERARSLLEERRVRFTGCGDADTPADRPVMDKP